MGLFTKNKKVVKKNNGRIRVKMTRDSICAADDCNAPHGAIIGVDSDGSVKDFINILIERYCPKMRGRDLIWVLSYNNRHLAVFNGTTGSTNVVNDNMVNMTMEDIVNGEESPAMYLHYISQGTIEDVARTMIIK